MVLSVAPPSERVAHPLIRLSSSTPTSATNLAISTLVAVVGGNATDAASASGVEPTSSFHCPIDV